MKSNSNIILCIQTSKNCTIFPHFIDLSSDNIDDDLRKRLKIEKRRIDTFLRKEPSISIPASPSSQRRDSGASSTGEDLRRSLLFEIQHSPVQLKSASKLRKEGRRKFTPEGKEIHSVQDTMDISKLNAKLLNRPSKEDLEQKNIIRTQETALAQKQAQRVMAQKDKLKRALMRRPSIVEVAEKITISELMNSKNEMMHHRDAISYTKNVKSHMYDINFFVEDNVMWVASGELIRLYDAPTGRGGNYGRLCVFLNCCRNYPKHKA